MYQYLYIQYQETFTTYKTCERVNKWGPGVTAQLANPPPLSARIHVSSDSCPGHFASHPASCLCRGKKLEDDLKPRDRAPAWETQRSWLLV